MKKIILFFVTYLISYVSFSQAPEGINYQAVIRSGSGVLVANATVAIRVQVRQTTATGTVIYQERHSVLTSAQGLINMVIGGGFPQVGTFNGINWGMGPYFVNLGVDIANGITYQDYGTQQLMSVPYALYSKTSGNQLNQWRYGNTVPPSTLGNLGDFNLDVITGNVYYKNSNTTWILTGNIKGPVGPSGTTGLTGAQGVQGIQGAQGAQGTQGLAGANGSNGQNTLVKTSNEAAGANCTTGGVKIEYGLDANINGTLDISEINATLTKYVCNGAVGVTGAQGTQGIQGAQGIQGVAGAAGTNGTNGVNGKNTLAKTTTEVAGANCITGGIKIEYGLDANNNGILDLSEINAALTKYVCNGAVGTTGLAGATGPQGIQGATGPTGATGPQGLQGTPGSLNAWSLTGNAGTNPTSNFIGTTDAQDWVIKTNNTERMRITSTGNVGIGTLNPNSQFTISEKDNSGQTETFAITDELNFKRFSMRVEGTSDTVYTNVRFDIYPKTNTDQAQFRYFLQTNTTGPKTVRFYRGNGTFVPSAIIGVDGQNSYFQNHGGNFGIGTSSPLGKFHVNNDVSGSDSSLVFTNSGKLGIGLSNPSHTLQAQNSLGSLLLSSITGATFVERAVGVPLKVIMGSNDNSVNYGQIELARGSGIGESAFISCIGDGLNGVSSVGISFQTLGLKFKVQSNGNVGIGVNTPQRSLHVSDVMRLEPRATAPTSPAKGDMYFDSTLNKLRVYDGTVWQNCW